VGLGDQNAAVLGKKLGEELEIPDEGASDGSGGVVDHPRGKLEFGEFGMGGGEGADRHGDGLLEHADEGELGVERDLDGRCRGTAVAVHDLPR
jgi:hypothetical protein